MRRPEGTRAELLAGRTDWAVGDTALTSGGIKVVILGLGREWATTARLDNGRSLPHRIANLRRPDVQPDPDEAVDRG